MAYASAERLAGGLDSLDVRPVPFAWVGVPLAPVFLRGGVAGGGGATWLDVRRCGRGGRSSFKDCCAVDTTLLEDARELSDGRSDCCSVSFFWGNGGKVDGS